MQNHSDHGDDLKLSSSCSMTAVRLYEFGGPEVLKVERHPIPTPAKHQVLVRVRATSVTGWDSLYRRGKLTAPPGRAALPLPQQLGREAAGEVEAVGKDVSMFSPADRVVVMVSPACGQCAYCRRGEDNLCRDIALPAHQSFGGYAEYIVVSEHGLLKAPKHLEFEKLACLLWSFGTAFHMVHNKAKLRPGESVLITGASGGMGTACIQLAKINGANPIIALTGSMDKADGLRSNGADVVLNYRDPDVVEQIREHTTNKHGVDVVLDNVGGDQGIGMAIQACRTGARLVLVAFIAGRELNLDIFTLIIKELSVLAARGSTRREQETVLALAAAGKIDPTVDARFALSDIRKATDMLENREHTGKIVVLPGGLHGK
ncbi:uncharacterized protein Z520_06385 [Fonsecaea multimorphosa CBS 102226]|uniref:Enoyl reductase (ER) domain-containing protein n=1 Tax=Fonsecaea multimorphosa CBS 102226 TaxID=1442371 RepID=A0A0D2JVW1_9EURO|nr:uncharacterized protein Z520_06385 [Fonsecaea multimorphosa CBS 102226]KIX97607.1 hypothetical protein Z520_06385 [Fonsecaea multimorphosa CBS 102226]OAL24072.1 hypothetical protein AYO22_05953 [Fonsecaea multimorphosa]